MNKIILQDTCAGKVISAKTPTGEIYQGVLGKTQSGTYKLWNYPQVDLSVCEISLI